MDYQSKCQEFFIIKLKKLILKIHIEKNIYNHRQFLGVLPLPNNKTDHKGYGNLEILMGEE